MSTTGQATETPDTRIPESQVIADLAMAAAEPTQVADGLYVVVAPDGEIAQIDTNAHADRYADRPRRKTGTFTVGDADSFAAYMTKHTLADSEVWADPINTRITAVINAHGSADDEGGWGDHTLTWTITPTTAWKAWLANNNKLLPQEQFAEHIETRAIDVREPDAATMLEMAQTFHATTGVEFRSSKRLSSGEQQITYRETTEASAGKTGQLEIPTVFKIGLQPFEGADVYGVTARLRYRINGGHLLLGYTLERPEDIIRSAFDDVVTEIRSTVEAPVLIGSGKTR